MTKSRRAALAEVLAGRTTNAGLWLDKYLETFDKPAKDEVPPQRKLLDHVLGDIEVPPGYLPAYQRRKAALSCQTGGFPDGLTLLFKASTAWRLLVGMGEHSVRETNISLSSTWGLPLIPGSALKGLAASTAHKYGDKEHWRKADEETGAATGDDYRVLFGDVTQAGVVSFHDAWWIPDAKKLPLALDVMTVHHPEYYQGRSDAPPADWDEPTPLAFLTAHGDYLLALTGPEEWVERAAEWLKIGLSVDGIGAKTAAGYGRMTLSPLLSEAEKAQRKLMDELGEVTKKGLGRLTLIEFMTLLTDAWKAGVPVAALAAAVGPLVADKAIRKELQALKPKELAELLGAQTSRQQPNAKAEEEWLRGKAWQAKDGPHIKVFVLLEGGPLASAIRKQLKTLDAQPELAAEIEKATKKAPVHVLVLAKKDRLRDIKR